MLTLTTIPAMQKRLFHVYTVSTVEGVVFAGYGTIRDIISCKHVMRNPAFKPDQEYTIATHGQGYESLRDVENALGAFIKGTLQGRTPPLNISATVNRYMPVRCIETGVVYRNAAHACEELDIPAPRMSMHLARLPGHKTIYNKSFEYTDIYDGGAYVRQARPRQIFI